MKGIRKMNNPFKRMTKREWALWFVSIAIVVMSNIMAGRVDALTLTATCIGVTSLIFCRTGKCMGTDIDDDFLHPVCDNIIPFSLLGRDVYLLIYVTSDVCLVDCDMVEKCEKQ